MDKTVQKVLSRDPVFLTNLFEDLNPRLIRYLATQKIFEESAEELIHECWETFFEKIEKFEGRSALTSFIFGILINKIREYRRRAKRTDYEDDAEKIYAKSFTKDGWWAQEPQDPQALLESKCLGDEIRDCLSGLTEAQRHAFLLIESEGESCESACNILQISVTNLRVLIFRAKNKLRSCLQGIVST